MTSGRGEWIVLAFACAIFLGCIVSPPGLMDDVDAVQAQIARHMLDSGDWVTARLNGVPYLEKAPLKYWMMAAAFSIFGVEDWVSRLPVSLGAVALCWVTARFAGWAFGGLAGLYSGLALATSAGLFLFTRVQIPDALLTLAIALALWSLLRALDDAEPRPRAWALGFWSAIGVGLLLKGLIAAVFPVGIALLYLTLSGQLLLPRTWQRLRPLWGIPLLLSIAAPWHVLATLRNPPYFDFTLHSRPGEYRGFFWFYFMNEHVLRFLNLRYPRDYNTVPRGYFWLLHLAWLFPWSVYFPAAAFQQFRGPDRAPRTRLLALCWAAVVLGFFSFSTTQEYYSLPCYPALALLIGPALARGGSPVRYGTRAAAALATVGFVAAAAILVLSWGRPTPGDIATALNQNPELYTLSLGHLLDLRLDTFAYLRLPLGIAAFALLVGASGAWLYQGKTAFLSLALMMAIFCHAARIALVRFEPYLGSRPLAEALLAQPEGRLIVDDQYYAFSSVLFYANREALLLNGRKVNLEYGSYAPGAPDVFIDDEELRRMWPGPERLYLVAADTAIPRLQKLLGGEALRAVARSGGKALYSNR
jgi:4-amino-4-deoxy-L-arabinose transferase-like glycosyltransferase